MEKITDPAKNKIYDKQFSFDDAEILFVATPDYSIMNRLHNPDWIISVTIAMMDGMMLSKLPMPNKNIACTFVGLMNEDYARKFIDFGINGNKKASMSNLLSKEDYKALQDFSYEEEVRDRDKRAANKHSKKVINDYFKKKP